MKHNPGKSMDMISGCRLVKKIDDTPGSSTFHGIQENGNKCIVRVLNVENSSYSALEEFKQRYEILYKLDLPGVLKPKELIEHDSRLAVVFEEFEGFLLKTYLAKDYFPLKTFLGIAKDLALTLGQIHDLNIIHKSIRPSNILVANDMTSAKFTGFCFENQLTRESIEIFHHDIIRNVLSYISPEQTGRMDKHVGFGTDFYSLGVIFYEMVTGRIPFEAESPLPILHSHQARMPIPPCEVNRGIPGVVSDIIIKLLAKSEEFRYQTGFGLASDIENCIEMIEHKGEIKNFFPGLNDIPPRFRIPQNIIGRDVEISLLMDAFEKTKKGRSNPVFVTGFPGIGKSSLINEVRKKVITQNGYFISGKYDQFKGNEPYSSVYQGFRQLVKQVLSESSERVASWRQKLSKALGANASIMTEVIPELEVIIGKQAEIPNLAPEESKNRFHLVMKNFIRVFASQRHPLVLFMDDLQWSDPASIEFMNVMALADIPHLLWIGAYRPLELPPGHPLQEITRTPSRNIDIDFIRLGPLDKDIVNIYLSRILKCRPTQCLSLANLIHAKTEGNPFFVNQFIKTLYDQKLVTHDIKNGYSWHDNDIQELMITDNVVTLLINKIETLPEATRKCLTICACIGSGFDLNILAELMDIKVLQVLRDLAPAISQGFVGRAGDMYNFSHDRIQEAAYSLIPENERPQIHYKIGLHELRNKIAGTYGEKLFYIVNQLNFGIDFIKNKDERKQLIGLNIKAGEKAKNAAAYSSASAYFSNASKLLSNDCWTDEYASALLINMELAVCENLCKNFKKAEKLFDLSIKMARTKEDKALVYSQKLVMLAGLTRFSEALTTGIKALRLLSVRLPKKPGRLSILSHMLRIKLKLGSRTASDLHNLPDMTDSSSLLVMRILMNLTMTAYFYSIDLATLIALKMFLLTLNSGASPLSPYAIIIYAVAVGVGFENFRLCGEFGELAVAMDERFKNPEIRAKVEMIFGGGVSVWTRPAGFCLEHTENALAAAMENGDQNTAVYIIQSIVIQMIAKGAPLNSIEIKCEEHIDFIRESQDPGALNYIISVLQFIKCLKGETSGRLSLDGNGFSEIHQVEKMQKDRIPIIVQRHYLLKFRMLYIMNSPGLALEAAEESRKRLKYSLGQIVVPEHYFFHALVLTALAKREKGVKKGVLGLRAFRYMKKLKKYAATCPSTFEHKYLLIAAELSSLLGRERTAMDLYKGASEAAGNNGYIHIQAMACERAGEFYLKMGYEDFAETHLNKAETLYKRWGASLKAREIIEEYPKFFPSHETSDTSADDTGSVMLSMADIKALRSSLKIFAQETIHSRILEETIKTATRIAGANKGFLILNKGEGRLYIEAEASVDPDSVKILQSTPLEDCGDLSPAIVNYVNRTGRKIVVHDPMEPIDEVPLLLSEPYINENTLKSILCIPIKTNRGDGNEISGILYLENNMVLHAFTDESIEILEIICLSAAGRLDLSRRAVTDGLTSLYNHEYFQSVLQQEVLLSKRQGHKLSLIMMDLDHFKRINDTWGHQLGDLVLKKVSGALVSICRQSDIIARYGGEEIAVVLRETDSETAFNLAEKLRASVDKLSIESPIPESGAVKVTISAGVATYPDHASDRKSLIQKADEALYSSKKRGRNIVSMG